ISVQLLHFSQLPLPASTLLAPVVLRRRANSRRTSMQSMLKRKAVIGTATLAVAALGGGAYAATQSSSNPRQAFLNDVAKRLHVTPQQLQSAVKGAYLDRLQAAVAAGKLTQGQANA